MNAHFSTSRIALARSGRLESDSEGEACGDGSTVDDPAFGVSVGWVELGTDFAGSEALIEGDGAGAGA